MASISNERLRALAHEALAHLEYVNTHATTREGGGDVFILAKHLEAIERFLFKLIGC